MNPMTVNSRARAVRVRVLERVKVKPMFRCQIAASIIIAIFLLGALPDDANSGHTKEQTAEGIAVLFLLSAIEKAAASSANADRKDDSYSYHHGLSARDNAVAACVHRAYKALEKAGGLYMRFDKVEGVKHRGNNDFEVAVNVTDVYSWGHKARSVTCIVNHNQIKKFFSS